MGKPHANALFAGALELMLPKPDNPHDVVDLDALRRHACPVCHARRGLPCWWAAPRAVVSWCSHPSRIMLIR